MSDSYLAATVDLLWPSHADAGGAPARSERRTDRYVVIPSVARPKLLIPERPLRVAAGAIRNFKTASTRREQLRLNALALAARVGVHSVLPDRFVIKIPAGETGIDAHLSEVLEKRVHVSLYISPPRAVRKPVLQVLDGSGNTFAFAKVGVDDFTRSLIRAETDAVTHLSSLTWGVLQTPAVLHHGEWRGNQILVQSALPRGRTNRPDGALLRRAMTELAATDGVTSTPLLTSGYWHRLASRVRALPRTASADLLTAAVDEVERSAGSGALRFGCSHGDWAPWNMTASGNRLLVWDWEKYERDVPIGFDAVHFEVQGAVVLGGATPRDAFERALSQAESLVPDAESAATAALIVQLYAIDIAARYLVDREAEAGPTKMSDLPSWLEPTLAQAAATSARHTSGP